MIPTSDTLVSNPDKLMFVGDSETLIPDVSGTDSINIEISGDCIELSEDGRTLVAVKEGEATVTITYYGQEQILHYSVKTKEISGTFINYTGSQSKTKTDEETGKMTFEEEGIAKVEIPEGATATLNGNPYNGEAITEPGEYTLVITFVIKEDEYNNQLVREVTYNLIVPETKGLVKNEGKIIYLDTFEKVQEWVNDDDALHIVENSNIVISEDGKSFKFITTGEIEVTFVYYGQTQTITYKVIEKETEATFYDANDEVLTPEMDEHTGYLIFGEDGIAKVEIPEGATATLDGKPYHGEPITDSGSHIIKVTKVVSDETYPNELTQSIVYKFKIPAKDYGMGGLVIPMASIGTVGIITAITVVLFKKRKSRGMKK